MYLVYLKIQYIYSQNSLYIIQIQYFTLSCPFLRCKNAACNSRTLCCIFQRRAKDLRESL